MAAALRGHRDAKRGQFGFTFWANPNPALSHSPAHCTHARHNCFANPATRATFGPFLNLTYFVNVSRKQLVNNKFKHKNKNFNNNYFYLNISFCL